MENVILAGAHPDDLIGCAGMALQIKDKFKLHLFDFTKGELGLGPAGLADGSTAKIRAKEEEQAVKMINGDVHFLGEIDGYAYANKEVCQRAGALIRQLQPRALFTHWPLDTHCDHVMTTACMIKAVELSGSDCEIFFYEETYQSLAFHPHFYVDITRQMAKKVELIRLYACQNRNDSLVKNKTQDAIFRGSQICRDYAEAYAVFRPQKSGEKSFFAELDAVTY
ncbi:MAG: PIG-L family deacetylase [Victivallaceae bacterium]